MVRLLQLVRQLDCPRLLLQLAHRPEIIDTDQAVNDQILTQVYLLLH